MPPKDFLPPLQIYKVAPQVIDWMAAVTEQAWLDRFFTKKVQAASFELNKSLPLADIVIDESAGDPVLRTTDNSSWKKS